MAKVGRRLRRQLIKAASLTVVYGQGRGGFEDKGHCDVKVDYVTFGANQPNLEREIIIPNLCQLNIL